MVDRFTKIAKTAVVLLSIVVCSIWSAGLSLAITVDPFYAGSYTATSLGSVPGVVLNYGQRS